MNPPDTTDLESLRKAIQEYQPQPHRVPFSNLAPVHDSIVELRNKRASYAVIAELLQQCGIKTSRARVAEYGRIVLKGGKKRKRRNSAKCVMRRPRPQVRPPQYRKQDHRQPAVINTTLPPKENSGYVSRGPHIAKVILMSGEEAEKFNASLAKGPDSKP